MSVGWGAILVPAAVALFVAAGGWLLSRKSTSADAAKTITDAAKAAIDLSLGPLNKRIDELQGEVETLKGRMGETEDHRDVLAALVRRHIEWEDQGRPDPPGP